MEKKQFVILGTDSKAVPVKRRLRSSTARVIRTFAKLTGTVLKVHSLRGRVTGTPEPSALGLVAGGGASFAISLPSDEVNDEEDACNMAVLSIASGGCGCADGHREEGCQSSR